MSRTKRETTFTPTLTVNSVKQKIIMYSVSARNKLYLLLLLFSMRQSRRAISIACFQMQTEFVDEES